jgi:transcriptional regulator with XRE-family HTH domain
MPPQTSRSSSELGALIRSRRAELGLTIEEAARSAKVGSETWRRYEGGSSIRRDKLRGVLQTMRWSKLPSVGGSADADEPSDAFDEQWFVDYPIEKLGDSYLGSLAESIGDECARTFAFGIDGLLDHSREDLEELAKRPRGTHLGELGMSWLVEELPVRWVPRYDYDFVFRLRATAETIKIRLKWAGADGNQQLARSVADKLVVHLIFQDGMTAADSCGSDAADDWEDWVLDLTEGDDEFLYALFSNTIVWGEESRYHFDNWFLAQSQPSTVSDNSG